MLLICFTHCPRASAQNAATSSPTVADQVEKAKAAFARGDYAEALRLAGPAADQGSADAQAVLGLMYVAGQGVPVDYAHGLALLRKSADQGSPSGEGALGICYQHGLGVAKDDAQAAAWYRKAAEQGLHEAQASLAQEYLNGWGIPRDYHEAMIWARKAADQGDNEGEGIVGNLYLYGLGVPKNPVEGLKWFGKAAEDGNQFAQLALGSQYYGGNKEFGVPDNKQEALRLWQMAADQGNEDAKKRLAKYGSKFSPNASRAGEKVVLNWELRDFTDKMTDKTTQMAVTESDVGDGVSFHARASCLGFGIKFYMGAYRGTGGEPEPYELKNNNTVQVRLRFDDSDVHTVTATAEYTNEAYILFIDKAALKRVTESGPPPGPGQLPSVAAVMAKIAESQAERTAAGALTQLVNARSIRVELPLANGKAYVIDLNPQDQTLKSFIGQCVRDSHGALPFDRDQGASVRWAFTAPY